jgi:hypothetical protein
VVCLWFESRILSTTLEAITQYRIHLQRSDHPGKQFKSQIAEPDAFSSKDI